MSLVKKINGMPPQYSAAVHVAYHAHKGVLRREREHYINHCLRVAEQCLEWHMGEDCINAAILHDIIEDTHITAVDLLNRGFSLRCIELVKGMTKLEGEPRDDYIIRILASGDIELLMLKLADLNDNSNVDVSDSEWSGWEDALVRYAHEKILIIKAVRELKMSKGEPTPHARINPHAKIPI